MKKTIAIILEIIPVLSAVLSYTLVVFGPDSALIRTVIAVTFLLAFLGFVFFFVGRWLAKEDKAVRILGIFDWLSTVFIIAIYVVAFLSVGL
jgi:hypothetical protein